MHIPGYSPDSYTTKKIYLMALAGRDVGSGRRGRKASNESLLRRVNKAIYKEKHSFYRRLWGNKWCNKHNVEKRLYSDHKRCPKCKSEASKKRRKKLRLNPEYRKAEKRRYREWVKQRKRIDPVFREKYNAMRYEELKRRIASNEGARDKYYQNLAQYRVARRKRERDSPISWRTIKLFKEVYAYCLKCGSSDDLTIDHIIPVARGGSGEFSNLQCLCRSCNSKKQCDDTDYRVRILVPKNDLLR